MRLQVIAAAIMLSSGCSAPLAPQDVQARLESLAAQSDTAGLVSLANGQCKGEERPSCLEDFFLTLAANKRVALALGALERLGAGDENVVRDGHGLTHVIGIRAWKPGDDVAAVFRSCNGLYQSGCYHGVIQAYLTADGTLDSLRAVQLCDKVAAAAADRWLRFQCVHGLGHGFEMAQAWELPRALEKCDWLGDSWDRESCYGGAFMENAVASHPGGHHTSARALAATTDTAPAAQHDDHGSHSPDPSVITFRMRDSTDALYPCTIVDARYLRSCYQVQGGIILNAKGQDFTQAAKECDRVESVWRSECYLSLGTNASAASAMSASRAISLCSTGDPAYQPWCIVGAVKNFIDVTARAEDGVKFCREVKSGDNRSKCWIAVGEQIATLHPTDPEKRTRECARAPEDGVAECRRAAYLQ